MTFIEREISLLIYVQSLFQRVQFTPVVGLYSLWNCLLFMNSNFQYLNNKNTLKFSGDTETFLTVIIAFKFSLINDLFRMTK